MKNFLSKTNSCTGVMLTLQSSPRIKRDSCDPLTVLRSCSSAGSLHRALTVFLFFSLLLSPFSSSAQVLTLNDGDVVTYIINLNSITEISVPEGTAMIISEITGSANPLKKTGAGRLILANVNTYTSATQVVEGTLQVGNLGAGVSIDNTAGIDVGQGATLTFYTVENMSINNIDITNNSIVKFCPASFTADIGYYGTISGSGGVIAKGRGVVNFDGDHTYTGTTIIDSVFFILYGTIENSSWVYLDDWGGLQIFGDKRIKSIGLGTANSAIYLGMYTLTVGTAGESDKDSYIVGKVIGTGGINKIGTGRFSLMTNVSSATGTFTCSEGEVDFCGTYMNPSVGGIVHDGKWAGNFVKKPGSKLTIIGNPTIGGTLSMEGGTTHLDLSSEVPSKISVTGAMSASENNILNILGVGSKTSYPLIAAASGVSTSHFTTTGINGTLTATDTTLIFTPIFVPVTGITNVPTTTLPGVQIKLTGTVEPSNATNQKIKWSVVNDGTTGATIKENDMFLATSSGEAMLMATIDNGLAPGIPFVFGFNIKVDEFIPVTDIDDVPTKVFVGEPLKLTGKVLPDSASNKEITWSIFFAAATTGAELNGDELTTTGEGLVVVTATIANGADIGVPFTKNFELDSKPAGIASTELSNQILVYPNPTSGEFKVQSSRFKVQSVDIYDVYGRKALVSPVSFMSPETTVNISNFSAGIYFVKITTENGVVEKKVIKH